MSLTVTPQFLSCGDLALSRARLDGRSRVSREAHARNCESLGVRFPGATRPAMRANLRDASSGLASRLTFRKKRAADREAPGEGSAHADHT